VIGRDWMLFRCSGSLVTFIPVTDGDPATDENGYAGSAINSVAFAQNNLPTVGDRQFIAYYRRHATDSSHPDNNTIRHQHPARPVSQIHRNGGHFHSIQIRMSVAPRHLADERNPPLLANRAGRGCHQ